MDIIRQYTFILVNVLLFLKIHDVRIKIGLLYANFSQFNYGTYAANYLFIGQHFNGAALSELLFFVLYSIAEI